MAPKRKEIRKLYSVYKKEGVSGAAQAVQGYIRDTSQSYKKPPGYILNKIKKSTPIWERDWDICCVLDGCRYDTFEKVYQGESERIRSVASTSQTWIPRTFENRDLSDVAYISANPFSNRIDTEEFGYFHLEGVRETQYGIETVPPRELANRAIHVWRNRDQYGVNQVIVHFMQPHVPFRSYPSLFEEFRGDATWGSKVWRRIDSDMIDRERFFEAYEDNLKWVLEEGTEVIKDNADATISMTADHGNAAGEWGYYGHPSHAPVSSVRVVPWAVTEGVDRGKLSPDIEHDQKDICIDDQLEALGYK